ncbi:hypothetical protein BV25DRAFT_1837157 [Artomyces pyxidatus]|uniref:Uncharacterized protein n=1 Tax=Artomyces pyxidatus TaxID=48021 RepID=A0ACB8T5I2_9AGAM|nr:hypothetical protein BV25DRAFT_1837157 [Artomyces pyxidatus]
MALPTSSRESALSWLASLPHPVKIVIAGNHDSALDSQFCDQEHLTKAQIDWSAAGVTYLQHAATRVTVRGRSLTVFGSPYTPSFGCFAFQYPQPLSAPDHARMGARPSQHRHLDHAWTRPGTSTQGVQS